MKKSRYKELLNMLHELVVLISEVKALQMEPAPLRVNTRVQVQGLNKRLSFMN
jgi:hypothetical protein